MGRSKITILILFFLFFLFVVSGFSIPGVARGAQDLAYNLARSTVLLYAGWAYCRRERCGFRVVFLLGMSLSFFDHIVLKGGFFLINGAINTSVNFDASVTTFVGVVISYFFYVPFAVLLVYLGSKLAKVSRSTDESKV